MGRPIPSYVTEEDVKLQNKLSALKAQTQAYDEPMVLENWVLENCSGYVSQSVCKSLRLTDISLYIISSAS